MASSILLRGGTLLVHDDTTNSIVAVKEDLLIIQDRIAAIGNNIVPSAEITPSLEVVDCTRKIISPGFIDTHHHLWQTQLKGRHGDHTVFDYMISGNLSASFFTPSDIFWGQLGGALEALDSGTTTVVDHAHMNYSESHSESALAATLVSGIRSIFCYTPSPLVESWKPRLTLAYDIIKTWHYSQLNHFASLLASHPRVSLGFGFDGYALMQPDGLRHLFQTIRTIGVQCITSHYFRNPLMSQGKSLITSMAEMGLLAEDIIISHAIGTTTEEEQLLAQHNVSVSCTPACEMMQGLGTGAAFTMATGTSDAPNIIPHSNGSARLSLGCDSHSVARGSMVEQMRLVLAVARMRRTQGYLRNDRFPVKSQPTVQEVFQLATTHGARAIGRENDLGKLKVGYKADVVVWDCRSPNMVCAAAESALTGVVCHAGTKDVESVIVDGAFRKRNGRLVDCAVQGIQKQLIGDLNLGHDNDILCWERIADALEQSRREIEARMIPFFVMGDNALDALIEVFGLDGSALAV